MGSLSESFGSPSALAAGAMLLAAPVLPPGMKGEEKPASATASLCVAGEEVLFSCAVGGKVASVCGQSPGQAVYRFGRAGRTELQSGGLRHAATMFSGGGESQVHFERGGYRYVLFDRSLRSDFGPDGRHEPGFSSGLLVLRQGRLVRSRGCLGTTDPMISGNLAAYMPEGEYIAH